MTGFIVSVFPFRNRVSSKEAFEGLELGERKLSRPVLRGPGGRKVAWLLGMYGPPLCRKRKMKVDRMVCANVFGLLSEHKLLALMECAARSSSLVMQPWKAFPVYRFRERRVRPLCHLIVRQQTWQKIINSVVAAGL
jgi:hypothetical protein